MSHEQRRSVFDSGPIQADTARILLNETKSEHEKEMLSPSKAGSDSELKDTSTSTKKPRPKGAKWDGRLASMSLDDYRAHKWSLDAGYNSTFKSAPKYSCRRHIPPLVPKSTKNFVSGDPVSALLYTKRRPPNFSMSMQSLPHAHEKTPGPGQYRINNPMDPTPHPTVSKNGGARFSCGHLLHKDGGKGPAPGQYQDTEAFYKSGMVRSVPNFTIQGREAWFESTKPPMPGVGEYNSPQFEEVMRTGKKKSLKWTAQGKTLPLAQPRGERRCPSPGPPHYEVPMFGTKHEHVSSTKPQAARWGWGSEDRGLDPRLAGFGAGKGPPDAAATQ